MKAILNIVAFVLILVGCIWILQGINILPGSFMTGQIEWAVYGGMAVAVGISLFLANNRGDTNDSPGTEDESKVGGASRVPQNPAGYARMLTRISEEWGEWDEFTQVRRPLSLHYEFRRSTPLCLLAGLGLAGLALDFWFLGLVVDKGQFLEGFASAITAALVFPIGRGVIVDGMTRRVTRWWGWVHKPVLRKSYDFSAFRIIDITKKLGPKPGEANVGRDVFRPVYLVTLDGNRILLKTCTWVKGARALGAEVAAILSIPVNDHFPDDEDSIG